MRTHLAAVALGGLLVAGGFLLGRQAPSIEPQAQGQVVAVRGAQNEDIFASGRPALITTSEDGLSLHVWTFSNTPERINDTAKPRFVGTVTAEVEESR